jgi:hypothetical protein
MKVIPISVIDKRIMSIITGEHTAYTTQEVVRILDELKGESKDEELEI